MMDCYLSLVLKSEQNTGFFFSMVNLVKDVLLASYAKSHPQKCF